MTRKKTSSRKAQGKSKGSAASRKSPRSSAGTSKNIPHPKNFLQLGEERWPLERDVLFRPDRLKYVRKLIPEQGCVFCRCAAHSPRFDTLCVHQTEYSMVVLNKYPYNSGHVLVLPKRHVGEIFDLSEEEYVDLALLQRQCMEVVREVYEPAGFNLGMNHGRVSGAGIPEHLHYHIVPRWAGDLNFFPLIAETKLVIENLETSFDRLRTSFHNLKLKGSGRK